jgi:dolichol kinase
MALRERDLRKQTMSEMPPPGLVEMPHISAVEQVTYDAQGRRSVPIQWSRRIFHMSSATVPLIVMWLGVTSKNILFYTWPLLLLLVVPEIIRLNHAPFNRWFIRKVGFLMRPNELTSVHTAAIFASALYLGVFLFGVPAMLMGFLCLSIGDPVAAIVGLKFGRIRIFGKTLEGSLACFAVCLGIGLLLYPGQAGKAAIAALAATLGELIPLPVNDNLRIPFAVGLALTILGYFSA